MKILSEYLRMVSKREIRVFEPNPFLRDIGENNYELLNREYCLVKKSLIK